MFCVAAQHCMMHHTVQKKVNHSTAASQERTPAKPSAVPGLPAGNTCWRTRWASPVLRTCLIVTHGMGGQGTSHCQTANMAAPVVGAEELPNPPALDSLMTAEKAVVGMLCCRVSLYLIAAGHEDAQGVANCGASCSPE